MIHIHAWKPLPLYHNLCGQKLVHKPHAFSKEDIDALGEVLAVSAKAAWQRQPTLRGLAIGLGIGVTAVALIYFLT